jgi:hypothetical protein
MNIEMIIGGILLTLSGLFAVHKCNKQTELVLRLLSITVTMLGVGVLWLSAVLRSPAIMDMQVRIVGTYQNSWVAEFTTENVRDCKIEKIEAYLTGPGSKPILVDSTFMVVKRVGSQDVGYIILKDATHYAVDKVDFKVTHFCPFGVEVKSELAPVRIPELPKEPSVRPNLKEIT